MKKVYFLPAIITLLTLISCLHSRRENAGPSSLNNELAFYSKVVDDSFFISLHLPEDYHNNTDTHYPVIYVLDANFQFLMLSSSVRQYEKAGLLPPLILVGIGYKSFELMDSLRVRDDLYPAALPSDEMSATGGGRNFYNFITNQLIPYIDSGYKTIRNNRALLGHSFAGYFSLYALLHQTEEEQSFFKYFASASPALWYHNFYLDQLPQKLSGRKSKDTLGIFMSVGGLEDSVWNIAPFKKLTDHIAADRLQNIKLQCDIYSGLGHMDVSTITFLKALQKFYSKEK